jgi:uncharacterized membrane protein (UPF0127 family)
MAARVATGYAFNRTRSTYLATELLIANSHWTRFRGLMATPSAQFRPGQGLWIVPCHGVHTLAMRFPIDVVYLDSDKTIVHLEKELKPWRMAAIRVRTASVLELPAGTVHDSGTTLGDQVDIFLQKPLHTEAA